MIPLCPDCGTRHQAYQAHVFPRVKVQGTSLGKTEIASNAASNTEKPLVSAVRGAFKQRWPRESYNAYQREYMRKLRAERRANGPGD